MTNSKAKDRVDDELCKTRSLILDSNEILRESFDAEEAVNDNEESDNKSPPAVTVKNGKNMMIVVMVLCGLFTPSQKALTHARTK